MGCDIHSFVEIKSKKTGKWKKATGFKNEYYNPHDEYFSQEEFYNGDCVLNARNYDTFAILANVRNGRGFAGCDTGDAIKPISMPKGLPEDVCDEIKEESDRWGLDGHSHSWLTAKEISEYENDDKKVHRGWVDVEGYKRFKETGEPYPCYSMISGNDKIIHASNDECEKIQEENPNKEIYTQIQWEEDARDSAKWLFGEALNQLMARSESGKGDDIRIVFWFDN